MIRNRARTPCTRPSSEGENEDQARASPTSSVARKSRSHTGVGAERSTAGGTSRMPCCCWSPRFRAPGSPSSSIRKFSSSRLTTIGKRSGPVPSWVRTTRRRASAPASPPSGAPASFMPNFWSRSSNSPRSIRSLRRSLRAAKTAFRRTR